VFLTEDNPFSAVLLFSTFPSKIFPLFSRHCISAAGLLFSAEHVAILAFEPSCISFSPKLVSFISGRTTDFF